MPLAKPIRASRRTRHAANARDRVIKLKLDIFQSTAIICEFLYYTFNTILGLREIYPQQDFRWEKRYDIFLPLLVDPDLKRYLTKVTTQLKPWLETKKVNRVVLALVSKETRETVERWQFDIQAVPDPPVSPPDVPVPTSNPRPPPTSSSQPAQIDLNQQQPSSSSAAVDDSKLEPVPRSDHDMQAEALQIFRQIFSSVSFMPSLEPDECLFTILSYVDRSVEVPGGWRRSNPHIISATADQVPIHGLTTSVHRLIPTVTYCGNRAGTEEEKDE